MNVASEAPTVDLLATLLAPPSSGVRPHSEVDAVGSFDWVTAVRVRAHVIIVNADRQFNEPPVVFEHRVHRRAGATHNAGCLSSGDLRRPASTATRPLDASNSGDFPVPLEGDDMTDKKYWLVETKAPTATCSRPANLASPRARSWPTARMNETASTRIFDQNRTKARPGYNSGYNDLTLTCRARSSTASSRPRSWSPIRRPDPGPLSGGPTVPEI